MSGLREIDRTRRLCLRAGGTLLLGAAVGVSLAQGKERTIRIVAKKFEFVPAVLHVKQGEPVLLQLTAPEVPMGFNLADFLVRTDVVPGKAATLRFTPDRAGTFTFVCDVFCGSGHEDMSGTLIVT